MNLLLVALGGALGAIARTMISDWMKQRFPHFPLGTLTVNLLGSFFLGVAIANPNLHSFGIGFLGAFTTFSTFQWESFMLAVKHNKKKALIYQLLSYIFGVLFAFLGYHLAKK